jgi:hypothetical protein
MIQRFAFVVLIFCLGLSGCAGEEPVDSPTMPNVVEASTSPDETLPPPESSVTVELPLPPPKEPLSNVPATVSDAYLTSIDLSEHNFGYTIDIYSFSVELDNYLLNSGERAGVYIEYPVVKGLQDEEKQKEINGILKREVLRSNNTEFESTCVVVIKIISYFASEGLLSIAWSDYSNYTDAAKPAHHYHRANINIRTGKLLCLSDFMKVDERLIYRGNDIWISDYGSMTYPDANNLKDLFGIYENEEDRRRPGQHWQIRDDAIIWLQSDDATWFWSISDNNDIFFYFGRDWVSIPYHNLADLIYPEYLAALESPFFLYGRLPFLH